MKPNAEQLALFRGITERDKIMARYEADHKLYLSTLRSIAVSIAATKGEVCVDDVRRRMKVDDFPMPSEVGASEKIFGRLLSGCAELEFVERKLSTRAERLARSGPGASGIDVYRLRNGMRDALRRVA